MNLDNLEKVEEELQEDESFVKLKPILKQMSNVMFKYAKKILSSKKKLSSYHNKLVLDLPFLIYLSNQPLYKKYSRDANYITKWLKKYKYISKKSMVYPINSKFLTSTLAKSFLKVDLPLMDLILEYRDQIFDVYKNKIDVAIYIYLRVFHLEKIDKKNIIKLNIKNIVNIKDEINLHIYADERHSEGYILMNKFFLDTIVYAKIVENYENTVFKKDLDYYEKELRIYLKTRNLFHQDIKNSIHFEYAYLNSQLDLILDNTTANYPKLNLLEIEHMHPGVIPKKFLDIEKHNFDVYFHKFIGDDGELDKDDEDLDDNSKAGQYIIQNIEAYEDLSKCKKVPLNNKDLQIYLNKYYRLIENFKSVSISKNDYIYKIFDFVEYLLKKADSKYTPKPIKPSTLKEYIRVIFKYCFHYIITHGKIDDNIVAIIMQSLNNRIDRKILNININFTPKTSKTYLRIIKVFLRKQTKYNTNNKIKMIVDIRRSIVFLDEIDKLVKELINESKEKLKNTKEPVNQLINESKEKLKNTKNLVRHKTYKHNQYAVFCLLLYYSGLRKSEARTLLTKNIFQIHENEYEIIVNKENFRLTAKVNSELDLRPKSDNAVRRVRFIVKHKEHNKILKKHINFLQTNKHKFVFPAISKKGNVLKTSTILNNDLDFISKRLATITGRYTPLHSLRHSYATFKLLTKYKQSRNSSFYMYLISLMMGHSEPSVTIQNYIHIDLLKILLFNDDKLLIPDLYVEYNKDLQM